MNYKYYDAAEFLGKTLTAITPQAKAIKDERIEFTFSDGKRYSMQHSQCCCESVAIHDVTGDFQSITGAPLIVARQETSQAWPEDVKADDYPPESFTWSTFWFETDAAKVRVRWLGTSNGYYGEGVDIEEIE